MLLTENTDDRSSEPLPARVIELPASLLDGKLLAPGKVKALCVLPQPLRFVAVEMLWVDLSSNPLNPVRL